MWYSHQPTQRIKSVLIMYLKDTFKQVLNLALLARSIAKFYEVLFVSKLRFSLITLNVAYLRPLMSSKSH